MPRYDYECSSQHVNEFTFSMNDKPKEVTCPDCGKPARSIVSGTNVNSSLGEFYWPKKGHMGRTVENLGHKPIHFDTKKKYKDYLTTHGIRERG